jgi:hypothetical protein
MVCDVFINNKMVMVMTLWASLILSQIIKEKVRDWDLPELDT